MSRSLRVFVVEQFGHANKQNTSDRIDKSINLNPVGNIYFFGSSINSTLSFEIVEGSINSFTLSEVVSFYKLLHYNSFFY